MADFAKGDRLRELREDEHLSQERFAQEVGVSTKTIRAWEKSKGIKWKNAVRAAEFFKVDTAEIVSHESERLTDDRLRAQLDRIEAAVDELLERLPMLPEPPAGLQAPETSQPTTPTPKRRAKSRAKTRP